MEPHLFDPKNKVILDKPQGAVEDHLFALGATCMLHRPDGFLAGVYVDDTTPNRRAIVTVLRASLPSTLMIVVGANTDEPLLRMPGCICAYEWYPFHQGWGMPTHQNLGLDKGDPFPEAWILQWNFGWPHDVPPTKIQRQRLLWWVRIRHPKAKLIWLY